MKKYKTSRPGVTVEVYDRGFHTAYVLYKKKAKFKVVSAKNYTLFENLSGALSAARSALRALGIELGEEVE